MKLVYMELEIGPEVHDNMFFAIAYLIIQWDSMRLQSSFLIN